MMDVRGPFMFPRRGSVQLDSGRRSNTLLGGPIDGTAVLKGHSTCKSV
jgi:hypothetical protein